MDNTKMKCQIIRCVSSQENQELIGIDRIDETSFNTAICTSCAEVFGVKHGDDIPENGKELLDKYYIIPHNA